MSAISFRDGQMTLSAQRCTASSLLKLLRMQNSRLRDSP
jgi:hypothetical protein